MRQVRAIQHGGDYSGPLSTGQQPVLVRRSVTPPPFVSVAGRTGRGTALGCGSPRPGGAVAPRPPDHLLCRGRALRNGGAGPECGTRRGRYRIGPTRTSTTGRCPGQEWSRTWTPSPPRLLATVG